MKIYANQLREQLKKGLMPIYLISGEVPTLIQESILQIRETASVKEGFKESLRYQLDTEFDWEKLENILEHFSLFQENQLIELNATTLNFGAQGAALLTRYAENPHPNKLLILSTPKLDAKTQKAAWAKHMMEKGVYIPIWPLDSKGYQQWIQSKLEEKSLSVDREGIRLLAEYTEGNYAQALQTIETLSLSYSQENKLNVQHIAHITLQKGQYDLYAWIDECFLGDAGRMILIFQSLRQGAIEPAFMLWAITQEIRKLIHICICKEKKLNEWEAFKSQGIWEKKQPLFKKALSRHTIRSLEALLEEAFHIDQTLKGARTGDIWDQLMNMGLLVTLGSSQPHRATS